MRKIYWNGWWAVLFFLMVAPVWAGEKIEYYRELFEINSKPYHLEGLWPILEPKAETRYQFARNERGLVLRITYFNKEGKKADNVEGWSDYQIQYDEKGRMKEAGFLDTRGRWILHPTLGFAKEKVEYDEQGKAQRLFFNAKGKMLKTPQNNSRIESFPLIQ